MYRSEQIRDAALNMIVRFGDEAPLEVDQRIAELSATDNDEALGLWIEIRKAVLSISSVPVGRRDN